MYQVDEMKENIQQWFSMAHNCKEVCDTYLEILKETERQYDLCIRGLIKGE